jgi:MSHA type pilus biogenesis protein MshL
MKVITKKTILLLLPTLFLLIMSCEIKEDTPILPYDKDVGLTRSSFKENLTNPLIRNKEASTKKATSKLLPILSEPQKPKLAQGKLVSLKITDNVPLKDVFIELGRVAEVEIQIDPKITGGTIMIVKDRPFIEVIAQICKSSNLRYQEQNGVLIIERDLPYAKNYLLPYINSERNYSSTINLSSSGGGSQMTSGGSSSLTTSAKGNLWSQITDNLKLLISNVGDEYISTNQKSGIITVSTTQKNHKNVKKYLDKVKKEAFSQVLIEAKIVEVRLKDEYHTGINWNNIAGLSSQDGFNSGSLSGSSGELAFVTIPFSKNSTDFAGTLNFIQSFGTTRTLSSPRLTATNNQQAILSFTENKVYFQISYEGETSNNGSSGNPVSSTTIASEIKTVPLGVILSLQPSIDLDNQEILMNIRPTISSSSESIKDPGVEFIRAQIASNSNETSLYSSEVPIVKTQELDTLLKSKSGQVMVIGGLIEQSYKNNETGIPFLQNLPLIGNFFKATNKETVLTETVIFIKATIINQENKVDNTDQNFYNKFTNDPSSFKFD